MHDGAISNARAAARELPAVGGARIIVADELRLGRRRCAGRTGFRARLPQDEVIYFLLPDRFENGDPSNDRGGLDRRAPRRPASIPTSKGLLSRGRSQGPNLAARLHPVARCDGDLARRRSSRTSRCRVRRARSRPATTATGSRTSPASIRTSAATEDFHAFIEAAHERGHEGLSGHRHQPHGRRHPLSRMPDECLSVSLARRLSRTRGAAGVHGEPINAGFLGDDAAAPDGGELRAGSRAPTTPTRPTCRAARST